MFADIVDQQMRGSITGQIEGEINMESNRLVPNVAKIDWFYVDKRFQGLGIGRGLVVAYTKYVTLLGVSQIELTRESSARTIEFYKMDGFLGQGRILTKVLETEKIQR
ncbi:MAG: GNAT family N-acetyltransferase [Rickettsiales bacterium]|jgi:GNAT superfamily N-acetyltransferase|nr:GNAT family N-acetyltransferase [Rickettsiales bacterium]